MTIIKKHRRKVKGKKVWVRKHRRKTKRGSVFRKKGHKVIIGAKPGSSLTEEEIEEELERIPEEEFGKIKRVNIADWEDYMQRYKGKRQLKLYPLSPGFVHPKRTRDVKLVEQESKDFRDVLQHELSHSMTDKESKEAIRRVKEEYIDRMSISEEAKMRRTKEEKIKISEGLAKKKKKEIFQNE